MRVSQVQVVVGFARDDEILLSAGKYLQKLSKELGVTIPRMTVPASAPPEAPRAIVPGQSTLLQLCLNRAELFTQPPDHVANDFGQSIDFAAQVASRFLLELMTAVRYEWVGAVSTINFPSRTLMTQTEAVTPASDRLVNIPRVGRDLSHFNLQIGFKESSHFITYSIAGYEVRTGTVQAPGGPLTFRSFLSANRESKSS